MRQKIIAGNWKMHKTIFESIEFIQDLKTFDIKEYIKVIICAPYTSLYTLSQQVAGTEIKLGAQNMHYEDQGAFTGEISPLMLLGSNVEYTILGHSERRQYFHETDELVNKKVSTALRHGLKPIICVGESLEQKEAGKANDVIKLQLEKALIEIEESDAARIVIAYEPVWAIGTGKTASPEDANSGCKVVRDTLKGLYSEELSQKVPILYGGSINSKNSKDLFSMEHIDGGLVGGASLRIKEFIKIISSCEE